jgi:hypothetical protein
MDSGGKSDASDGGSTNACAVNVPRTVSISANHGHTLTIPAADATSLTSKEYQLTIGNGHTHLITFTADDFVKLRAGTMAIEISGPPEGSATGHMHTVTVVCG